MTPSIVKRAPRIPPSQITELSAEQFLGDAQAHPRVEPDSFERLNLPDRLGARPYDRRLEIRDDLAVAKGLRASLVVGTLVWGALAAAIWFIVRHHH